MTKYVIELNREPQHLQQDLKNFRIWLDGYKANGGDMPLGIDVVRQLQVAIGNAKTPHTDATTAARAKVIDYLDNVQEALDKAVQSFLYYDNVIGTPVPQPEPEETPKTSGSLYRMMVKRPGDGRGHQWMQMASSAEDARATCMKHHPGYTIHSVEPA